MANGISKTSVGSLHICLVTLCNSLCLVIEKTGKKSINEEGGVDMGCWGF